MPIFSDSATISSLTSVSLQPFGQDRRDVVAAWQSQMIPPSVHQDYLMSLVSSWTSQLDIFFNAFTIPTPWTWTTALLDMFTSPFPRILTVGRRSPDDPDEVVLIR